MCVCAFRIQQYKYTTQFIIDIAMYILYYSNIQRIDSWKLFLFISFMKFVAFKKAPYGSTYLP